MGNTLTFKKEDDFEKALIDELLRNNWQEVLAYKDEKDLIENWKNILFENNNSIDRLDKYPLTDTEMDQILDQINNMKSPCKLNGFINGKTISIKRDNPDDVMHFGKEISLKIFDKYEISAGKSRYQIVEQPRFYRNSNIQKDRRGDLLLLINGMPLIHIELKASGVNIGEAIDQINKYNQEGIFRGIFSLIQIFVAMTPEETIYFANNPDKNNCFNSKFYFHWADVNNEPINDWKTIAAQFLSIPMAHRLIGFYTVADGGDNNLKVLRSYQYYAVNEIYKRVSENKWFSKNERGGYIWHTTGSGKTMTSFKAAQLVADSKKADKVVFLMDRIELGNQSLLEYRGFAGECTEIQATENTDELITKLKSNDKKDALIVTSIQKMNLVKLESGINDEDIAIIRNKRLVFIIDECHRSTFGEMLYTIKKTFPHALYFGFSGTPIQEENKKDDSTTSDIFGNELHRYPISDGIRDKNVLGFNIEYRHLFLDDDIKNVLIKANCHVDDPNDPSIFKNPEKMDKYYEIIRGIGVYNESQLPNSEFETIEIKKKIIEDIYKSWICLSVNSKFHAILATNSIKEACDYYDLIQEYNKNSNIKLQITCVFDDSDTGSFGYKKEEMMIKMLEDYKSMFNINFTLSDWGRFKKDVALRLAHKKPYENLSKEKQLDLVIVVDQMLTGFDSKWVNTLYLDKVIKNEMIVQAFSRTNRLCDLDKPFGNIRCYRRPYLMEENVNQAFTIYSGNKTSGVFVSKLWNHLNDLNLKFKEIKQIYLKNDIKNFEKNPDSEEDRQKITDLFNEFNDLIIAAKIQGYNDDKAEQDTDHGTVTMEFDKEIYEILLQRYKELFVGTMGGSSSKKIPFGLNPSIAQSTVSQIDFNYFNTKFKKWYKIYQIAKEGSEVEKALAELKSSYLKLSPEDQEIVDNIILEIQTGKLILENEENLTDCINAKKQAKENDLIKKFCNTFGYDEKLLRETLNSHVTELNFNEFGRRKKILNTLDFKKAKEYFDKKDGVDTPTFKVTMKAEKLLDKFILEGGCEF